MLLHNDGLIDLDYDAATDVLTVRWPDIDSAANAELHYSFLRLNDTIRRYDIKKLLIDSRYNKVQVKEVEYDALMKELCEGLKSSRLMKTARLGSLDQTREPKAEKHANRLIKELQPPFAFKNFMSKPHALQWLQS
ncbi:hypothetical protein [Pontibacter mangrovi]|uniref:STAS/SEC14 domain-containing protein n=1 Tax=Pontibacter mangrovi TaxID=2589816 RepID=A0A501WAC1_9BACT|nr:hypothetical protein [Pontibacter mangrovi]TPE46338.1 hypothetical protein FJM65_03075 [Pontibacter mangrovi]